MNSALYELYNLSWYTIYMVRTRIAPSPTGHDIHIGNLYTALINYVYAKKNNGQFIVRIEDTDQARKVEGSEKRIFSSLEAYGIVADESSLVGGHYAPYRQSERLKLYQKYAKELIDKGVAYYCFCTTERLTQIRNEAVAAKHQPKYDRHCLHISPHEITKNLEMHAPFVIRLKIPEGKTTFIDVIRGEIKIENSVLDDQVLLKSDGFPTYHLAVVVDDYLMKISHVIRAEEWISSTPKHVLLYKAFGWKLPVFAHVPLLRNTDKSKLSKRKNAVWSSWYLQEGFLPEAVLNYLALMGWSHPQEKEIFTMDEYQKVFEIKDIKPAGPIFDVVKLEWMNGEYIRKSPISNLKSQIIKYLKKYQNKELSEETVEKTIPLVQTRMKKLSEYWSLVAFIFEQPEKIDYPLEFLKQAKEKLLSAYEQTEWKHEKIHEVTEQIANELNIKPIKLFMDIRYALSNSKVTAPLFEGMEIMGKAKNIQRLKKFDTL